MNKIDTPVVLAVGSANGVTWEVWKHPSGSGCLVVVGTWDKHESAGPFKGLERSKYWANRLAETYWNERQHEQVCRAAFFAAVMLGE